MSDEADPASTSGATSMEAGLTEIREILVGEQAREVARHFTALEKIVAQEFAACRREVHEQLAQLRADITTWRRADGERLARLLRQAAEHLENGEVHPQSYRRTG